MGDDVGGLRDRFYRELRRKYRDEGVNAFLYRYFWTDAVTELLEKYVPNLPAPCPIQPESGAEIRALLAEAVREKPALLLRPVPEKRRRKANGEQNRKGRSGERRDFWEELWLNDAGYQAGLITDTDYYLWLIQYLAVHDRCYKDTSIWDGRAWLHTLLEAGWLGAGEPRVPGLRRKKSGEIAAPLSTARIKADLEELAARLGTDRTAIASRLHKLEEKGEDYLPWLTRHLEQMALHTRIKDWFQNSGYPLIKEGDLPARFSAKKQQKQDTSMRLLEAYCASGQGGSFFRRDRGTGERAGIWRLTGDGFCLPDEGTVEALRKALERDGTDCFYIPLAVDLQSGCVLFLAGKNTYERAYRREVKQWRASCDVLEEKLAGWEKQYEEAKRAGTGIREAKKRRDETRADLKKKKARRDQAEEQEARYQMSTASLCFDFLRLDRRRLRQSEENPAGQFRLFPAFHDQAGKSFQTVLEDFLDYCKGECERTRRERIPREAIELFNCQLPPDIPEAFRWAMEGEESLDAVEAFNDSRSRPLERPGDPPA